MYVPHFETGKMDETRKLVLSVHSQWMLLLMHRLNAAESRLLTLFTALFAVALAIIFFRFPKEMHGTLIFWLVCIFNATLLIPFLLFRWRAKKTDIRSVERIWREIETMETNDADRLLFERIMHALRGSIRDETGADKNLRTLVDEASRTSALSRLTFIRELRELLQTLR